MRQFEGLVKTYHAVFGEGISDSIAQAVIKSQMHAEISVSSRAANVHSTHRAHQSHVKLVQDKDSYHQPERCSTRSGPDGRGWVKNKDKVKNKERGKEKARATERTMRNPRTRSPKGGAATAENGVTTLPTVGTEKRNRSTKLKAKLARPV